MLQKGDIVDDADDDNFFNARKHILLLINLAQHRTPPAPYLRQRFEKIIYWQVS
jgi:hypothetical protein